MADSKDIIYRVNGQDNIVFVNEEWDRFAAANGGGAVTSSKVLHHPLWDFIIAATTRELYRQILEKIRGGRSLQFTFRCDGPTCRRLLEMTLHKGDDSTVEFCTRTISEESRQPPGLPEFSEARAGELLRMCGWCKRAFVGETWAEVEEAIAQLRLFHRPIPPSITHGICERCYQEMITTLANA
jgi:hypothetical protein